jgi:hypothetical protein
MIKKIFKGKAFRAETGFRHGEETTAQDIINFETIELGNAHILRQAKETGIDLAKIPAGQVIWVTKTRKAAERYGEPKEIDLGGNPPILATDGEGGYLVFSE